MNPDSHERARMLIALSGREEVPHAQRSWLAQHLESCAACRQFQEDSAEAIETLRGISVAADWTLVSRAKFLVRRRAKELRRVQERLWAIWICCAAVALCTALTTAVLWYGLAWVGQRARISATLWGSWLVVFSLMPAILAAVVLLARGIHLADHNGSPDL